MPIEVQTRSGSCPTHGAVEGTREIPGSGFPFVVNAVRRYMARKKPYRCPTCGAPVTTN
jgi:hypothetical protein